MRNELNSSYQMNLDRFFNAYNDLSWFERLFFPRNVRVAIEAINSPVTAHNVVQEHNNLIAAVRSAGFFGLFFDFLNIFKEAVRGISDPSELLLKPQRDSLPLAGKPTSPLHAAAYAAQETGGAAETTATAEAIGAAETTVTAETTAEAEAIGAAETTAAAEATAAAETTAAAEATAAAETTAAASVPVIPFICPYEEAYLTSGLKRILSIIRQLESELSTSPLASDRRTRIDAALKQEKDRFNLFAQVGLISPPYQIIHQPETTAGSPLQAEIIQKTSTHTQLIVADLSKPQGVEIHLGQLSVYKAATAAAGVFSPTKLGLGLIFDTIPRAVRSHEASQLQKIFVAARNYIFDINWSGSNFNPKDLELIIEFLMYVERRAQKRLDRLTKGASDPSNPRQVMYAKALPNQIILTNKINSIRRDGLILEFATMLTAANILLPNRLNSSTILSKGKTAISMNKGALSSGHIKKPKRYVADLIANVDLIQFGATPPSLSSLEKGILNKIEERLNTSRQLNECLQMRFPRGTASSTTLATTPGATAASGMAGGPSISLSAPPPAEEEISPTNSGLGRTPHA